MPFVGVARLCDAFSIEIKSIYSITMTIINVGYMPIVKIDIYKCSIKV